MNQSSTSTSRSGGPLLDQALQWLNQGSMADMIGRISPSLKNAGNKVTTSYDKLSTTQKVVGGALLVIGVGYLASRNKNAAQPTSQASTLQELLYFVNDRIEGYQRAVDESEDAELRGYYKQLVSQSQKFANDLNTALRQQGAEEQNATTLKGKLYRRWMDAKASLTGQDEKAILGANIYGEEWALKAYEDALSQGTLEGGVRLAVERQYALSQKTYDKLKKLEAK
ncbi:MULTISPECIES: PA2169 family four-helix-bundle protein [Hymenobacter]|uniref:DUF2383 domain-containing protein n=1 Tax=Hymenobacter mucosus TaxID=1411120 RepID=A0A238ZKV8_9BACT|nr:MULTISPECIES: PA2169 family four-helix-bundle protein [Hymenobacter]SNR83303.1 conserved hypothetical protein [Hymenobacter mucosus]